MEEMLQSAHPKVDQWQFQKQTTNSYKVITGHNSVRKFGVPRNSSRIFKLLQYFWHVCIWTACHKGEKDKLNISCDEWVWQGQGCCSPHSVLGTGGWQGPCLMIVPSYNSTCLPLFCEPPFCNEVPSFIMAAQVCFWESCCQCDVQWGTKGQEILKVCLASKGCQTIQWYDQVRSHFVKDQNKNYERALS